MNQTIANRANFHRAHSTSCAAEAVRYADAAKTALDKVNRVGWKAIAASLRRTSKFHAAEEKRLLAHKS